MYRKILIRIAALLFSVNAASAAQTFDCSVDNSRGRGFIPDRIQVAIDEERGVATVLDPLISSLYKAPLKVRMSRKRDGRYWLRWRIKNLPTTSTRIVEGLELSSTESKTQVNYEAWLDPKSMQIAVRAKSRKSSNSVSGAGGCNLKR